MKSLLSMLKTAIMPLSTSIRLVSFAKTFDLCRPYPASAGEQKRLGNSSSS
jgi:hypothetical protein